VTTQGYLAHGLAARASQIDSDLAQIEEVGGGPRSRVTMGALVDVLDDDGRTQSILLLPGGDGTMIDAGEGAVLVLSPGSPLAASLLGLEADDVAEFSRGDEELEFEVVAVC
jgi:transcription elongation GreA/GreB family factor